MKQILSKYDVIVVGAGPAGSSAARRLAQTGLKVLLAEQWRNIGTHVQCAEFVPRIINNYTGLRAIDVAQQITGIKTFINGEVASMLRAPGYILNRSLWDKQLADAAVQAGVQVMTGVRVLDTDDLTVTLGNGCECKAATGRFILGCDGPYSVISRKLGNKMHETCIALQHEMYLTEPLAYAEIHFESEYYGGYAWVFPKGKTANVGIAVHISYKNKLKDLLEIFCLKLVALQVIKNMPVLSTTGGLIPTSGLAQYLADEHMLLAGDAAGCTHPITGAGIMNAVLSGHLAAKTVLQQINGTSKECLAASYTRAVRNSYGKQLAQAHSKLLMRNQGWTENKKEFAALIRNSWIAFPEYYMQ